MVDAAGKSVDARVPSEERFRQSMAGLAKSLTERAALHPDPVGEATARRAAVQAMFRARSRRLTWMLAGGGAAAAVLGVAAGLLFFVRTPAPPAATAVTPTQASGVAELPVPPPPSVATAEIAPAEEPPPPPLRSDEVREIQTRLRAFGFNAGPIDGELGDRTQGAIARYRQERGLAQAKADRDLLERLRRDPAPRAVAAAPRDWPASPPPQRRSAPPQRRSDGFDFLRNADANLQHWLGTR